MKSITDPLLPHPPCCGSVVPRTVKDPARRFSRRVNYGSFFVTELEQIHQTGQQREGWRAPSRIGDLRVVFLQSNSGGLRAVSLGWTATGNVRDHGRAVSHILKRFNSQDEAWTQFDESGIEIIDRETDDGTLVPKEAGSPEQTFFKLPNDVVLPQYFALKVNNTYGLLSPVSNVVTVSVMPPAAVTNSIWGGGSSQGQSGSNGLLSGVTVSDFPFFSGEGGVDQRNGSRLQPSQLALIITVPLILLVVGVCVLMVIVARRRKDPLFDKVHKVSVDDKHNNVSLDNSHGAGGNTARAGDTSPVLTPSSVEKEEINSMTKMPSDTASDAGTMNVHHLTEANGTPVIMSQHGSLSPVNHWPAEVLLAHYNKVQEAKERKEQPPLLNLRQTHTEDPNLQAKSPMYNTPDPFRSLSPQVRGSPTSVQNNRSLQQSNMNNVIYPPYYDSSPPIVTQTGGHLNSSRNITRV